MPDVKPNPSRVVTAECTRCGGKFSMTGPVNEILPLFKAWNEQHSSPCEQGRPS